MVLIPGTSSNDQRTDGNSYEKPPHCYSDTAQPSDLLGTKTVCGWGLGFISLTVPGIKVSHSHILRFTRNAPRITIGKVYIALTSSIYIFVCTTTEMFPVALSFDKIYKSESEPGDWSLYIPYFNNFGP